MNDNELMAKNPHISWNKTKANNTKCRRCLKTIPRGETALMIFIYGPASHKIKSFFCDKDGRDILNEARALMESRDL